MNYASGTTNLMRADSKVTDKSGKPEVSVVNGTADNFHWPPNLHLVAKKKKELFDKKLQSRSITAHVR